MVGGAAAGEVGQAGEGPVLAHVFVHVFAAAPSEEPSPGFSGGSRGGGSRGGAGERGGERERELRIGAFPVSGPEGVVGYRPTQDACLRL